MDKFKTSCPEGQKGKVKKSIRDTDTTGHADEMVRTGSALVPLAREAAELRATKKQTTRSWEEQTLASFFFLKPSVEDKGC